MCLHACANKIICGRQGKPFFMALRQKEKLIEEVKTIKYFCSHNLCDVFLLSPCSVTLLLLCPFLFIPLGRCLSLPPPPSPSSSSPILSLCPCGSGELPGGQAERCRRARLDICYTSRWTVPVLNMKNTTKTMS